MENPSFYITMAVSGLAGLAMLITAGLAGWRGWLSLKQQELATRGPAELPAANHVGARIELSDLRERIRKLEAIAAGVDL